MKIIIATGGTGGHIYPALALARYIKEQNPNSEIIFMGSTIRLEAKVVGDSEFPFYGYDIHTTQGNILKKAKSLSSMWSVYFDVKKRLEQIKPDIVIGFGGYVTVPILRAAQSLKIKTVLHEQNSVAGSANTYLSKKADLVITSYERTKFDFVKAKHVKCLGNPQASFIEKEMGESPIALKPDVKHVLIVMGSLGSSSINKHIEGALSSLDKKSYQTIFVTGKNDYDALQATYPDLENVLLVPFVDQMAQLFDSIDLIVSRAGATTIAEILAKGVPSILIPSPYVAANHQEINAKEIVEAAGAKMIIESDLSAEKLVQMIDLVVANDSLLEKMGQAAKKLSKTDAAPLIYHALESLIHGDHSES